MKVKKNFSFRNVGDALDDIFIDALNQLGNHVNLSIEEGIKRGVDIDGNAFEPLSEETKRLGGNKILFRTGKMQKRKKVIATTSKPTFSLTASTKYGAYHNTGFTQTNPKQWYYGAKVPQRKWFGISKDAKPGGTRYKKMQLDIKNRIETKFTGTFKKFF